MKFLICLPAFNEEQHIAAMIDELQYLSYPIVLSDASSTDNTVKIAEQKKVKILNRSGAGKGFAIQDSLKYAFENNYDYLLLTDCDQTYASEDFPKLLEHAVDFDMVIGTRNRKDIGFLRRVANLLITGLFNIVNGTNYKDVASGMRILNVKSFNNKVDADGFNVEPQMFRIAVAKNFKVAEIPIKYTERSSDDSKVSYYHLFILLYHIIRDRFKI